MNNKPTSNPFLTRSHRAVVDALWDNMVHTQNPHYGDFRKKTGGCLASNQWKARQLRGKSVSEFHNSSNKGEVVQANHNNNACNKSYDFDGIGNRNKTADSLTLPAATDGSPATAGTVKVDYDHMGRRFRKSVTTGGETKYSYFVYSGYNAIAKYTGNSQSALSLQKSYYWGLDLGGGEGTGGMLAEVKHLGTDNLELATPQTLFALMDGNGNITEYLKSDGTMAAHFEYDSFGNTLVSEGAEAGVVDHGFSSRAKDKDLGLVYYNYRYYNAVQGGWINRDPIAEEGGENLYGFVGNDGVNYFDSKGEKVTVTTSEKGGKIHVKIVITIGIADLSKGEIIRVNGVTRHYPRGDKEKAAIISKYTKDVKAVFNYESEKFKCEINPEIKFYKTWKEMDKELHRVAIIDRVDILKLTKISISKKIGGGVDEIGGKKMVIANSEVATQDSYSGLFPHEVGHWLGLHHPYAPVTGTGVDRGNPIKIPLGVDNVMAYNGLQNKIIDEQIKQIIIEKLNIVRDGWITKKKASGECGCGGH